MEVKIFANMQKRTTALDNDHHDFRPATLTHVVAPEPQQMRSRATQEAFIEAGWRLLQQKDWDHVSVVDIARAASRSVGVFYQRFGSREDFLSILLGRWITKSYEAIDELVTRVDDDQLIEMFLFDAVERIRHNRNLWRAALERARLQPDSWEPFRQMGAYRTRVIFGRIEKARGKPLSTEERFRISLALQLFNSVINNSIFNDPGPMHLHDPQFFPVMHGVFRMVCDMELP
jgi:AcrR family transcriptional regulator